MIIHVYSLVIRKTSLLNDTVTVKDMINLLNRSEMTEVGFT
jgi:hypothetical protein